LFHNALLLKTQSRDATCHAANFNSFVYCFSAAGKEDSDTNYPDDEVLAQLKALQSAGVGQKDGRWLDQIQVKMGNYIGVNFHSTSPVESLKHI